MLVWALTRTPRVSEALCLQVREDGCGVSSNHVA